MLKVNHPRPWITNALSILYLEITNIELHGMNGVNDQQCMPSFFPSQYLGEPGGKCTKSPQITHIPQCGSIITRRKPSLVRITCLVLEFMQICIFRLGKRDHTTERDPQFPYTDMQIE